MDLKELDERQKIREAELAEVNKMALGIIEEGNRVADVAHNAELIWDQLDLEFAEKTKLEKADFAFLFVATGLQVLRIVLMNKLTEIEKAGDGKKETVLHAAQQKTLKFFDNGQNEDIVPYHAPISQITMTTGVPYDATSFFDEKYTFFKGANHRFATVGHDPLLGLIFGTANIVTDTITHVDRALLPSQHTARRLKQQGVDLNLKFPIGTPLIKSNHVVYEGYKKPKIANQASTPIILAETAKRTKEEPKAVVAAMIKQIIHIGTDAYTPMGLQIPMANLVLSNDTVEELTKYISFGDVMKVGGSAGIAVFINFLISAFHGLLFEPEKHGNRDTYSVKTRKILDISNTIASGSNVIWVGANVAVGKQDEFRHLDIGGIMVTIYRLWTDAKFIAKVKEEYIVSGFTEMIKGPTIEIITGDDIL